MLKRFIFFVILAAVISFPSAQASAIPVLDENNKLKGALGITVLDKTYDVQFIEGTCKKLFNGCTEFDFENSLWAMSAAYSLLDQVFISTYDTNPWLIAGCESDYQCMAFVPYQFNVNAEFGWLGGVVGFSVDNDYGTLDNIRELGWIAPEYDSGPNGPIGEQWVYTKWTLSSTLPTDSIALPEPTSTISFLTGLCALAFYRRKFVPKVEAK